jgi:RNase P/RNase MRP subunit p29
MKLVAKLDNLSNLNSILYFLNAIALDQAYPQALLPKIYMNQLKGAQIPDQPIVAHKRQTIPPATIKSEPAEYNDYYKFKGWLPSNLITGEITVTEAQIIRDLLYMFQGIDGQFVKLTKSGFTIDEGIKIPKATRELVWKLGQLGWAFKRIKVKR